MSSDLKLIEDESRRAVWSEELGHRLRPFKPRGPLALDLFAGCGGLALGFEAAGFQTHGFELDEDACASYGSNLAGEITQGELSVFSDLPSADLIIAGPPCQPFSVGGRQAGLEDSRDGFPIFISAVERILPSLFLFENVRGLLYRNRWYLEQILERLRSLGYKVELSLLNAKSYGVPQNRQRVFVVGHRGEFSFPRELTSPQVTAGDALGSLAQEVDRNSKFLTPSMDAYVARYEKASKCINPRDLNLDRPARTLTCRNLAGATGDMHRIRLPDGRRRRLTVREAARLQSFPDWFEFEGTETSQFNQIGNAVPPLLALHLAKSVQAYLDSAPEPRVKAAQ